MTTPAAGSEELGQNLLDILNSIDHKYKQVDKLIEYFTAQNDAIYAAVINSLPKKREMPDTDQMMRDGFGLDEIEQEQVEVVTHNSTVDIIRQSIAKVFGKADTKPEERQG